MYRKSGQRSAAMQKVCLSACLSVGCPLLVDTTDAGYSQTSVRVRPRTDAAPLSASHRPHQLFLSLPSKAKDRCSGIGLDWTRLDEMLVYFVYQLQIQKSIIKQNQRLQAPTRVSSLKGAVSKFYHVSKGVRMNYQRIRGKDQACLPCLSATSESGDTEIEMSGGVIQRTQCNSPPLPGQEQPQKTLS